LGQRVCLRALLGLPRNGTTVFRDATSCRKAAPLNISLSHTQVEANPFMHTDAAALDGHDSDDDAHHYHAQQRAAASAAPQQSFFRTNSLPAQLPPKPPAQQSSLAAALAKALGGG
jgi:hypothetical protein